MNRRQLLHLLPTAALAATKRVTVTDLAIHQVRVNHRGNWVLVEVKTSAGVVGIGEASHGSNDAEAIAFVKQFFDHVRGRSVAEVEHLRAKAEPVVLAQPTPITAAVALSAIEQALWDIRGQLAGIPCHDLFGGALRTKIRNYANINRATTDRQPAGFAKVASAAIRDGFDAIKLAPWDGGQTMQLGIDCVKAVRDAIGPDRDLLIDGHSHFNLAKGLELTKAMEPLGLYWLEEVTPPGDLPAIDRAAKMKTAGGESIYGARGFYPYIAAKSVDIVMPDVKYCGGMLELKKIAALAEAAGNLPVSPHGPASPVGNLAAAHICATLPNFLILEYAYGEVPWRAELIDPPEAIAKGGIMTLADRPGLGAKLNAAALKRYAVSTA